MKNLFSMMLALAMALSLSACDGKDKESENPKPLEYIKIMSFNIRTGTSDRGTANAWDNRKSGVYEMLNSEQPLIVGLQEARKFQRTDILASCPDYAGFGVCRDTGEDLEGETGSVIYNKNLCSIEKYGYFWLTEKDTSVPNVGWDATYKRMATWAVVKVTKTGKRFFFINTHLDHEGPQAQAGGMRVIMQKFEELNTEKLPQVLVGDFNQVQDSKIFDVCLETMYNARKKAYSTDSKNTYNAWGGSSSRIIDHIFVSKAHFHVHHYKTLDKSYSGVKYISDHYPIYTTLTFK